jgi:hypothetical protein
MMRHFLMLPDTLLLEPLCLLLLPWDGGYIKWM